MSDWRKTDLAEQAGCMILDDEELEQLSKPVAWRTNKPVAAKNPFHKKTEQNAFPFIKSKKYVHEVTFRPLRETLSESK